MSVMTYSNLGMEGRLGNQLWQIASTIGLACTHHYEVSFPAWDYMDQFWVPDDLFDGRKGVESYTFARDLLGDQCVYLQSFSLFADVQDEIYNWFQPRTSVLRPDFHQTAIHVRRTDAVAKQDYFQLPSLDYYKRGMDIVMSEHPDTVFQVFSDDIAWCHEVFPDTCNFVTPALPPADRNHRGDPLGNVWDLEDFVFIMSCDAHIMSNSTFSWWAAWLSSNPHPIFPAKWYGPKYEGKIDEANFLLPGWQLL